MPTQCSCGATLPEDARFCHRCGKPQFEEVVVEQPPVLRPMLVPPPASVPLDADAPVSFSNVLALRTAILVASISTMAETALPFFVYIGPVVGGFAVAYLYSRRVKRPLSLVSAAKLAWMTALFNALVLTMIAALNIAVEGMGTFQANMRDQLAKQPGGQQAIAQMNNPLAVATAVLLIWIVMFVLSSLLHFAGAALATRLGKQSQRTQP